MTYIFLLVIEYFSDKDHQYCPLPRWIKIVSLHTYFFSNQIIINLKKTSQISNNDNTNITEDEIMIMNEENDSINIIEIIDNEDSENENSKR